MIVTGAGDGAAIENIAPVRSMRVDGPGAWRISKFSTKSADTMCMRGRVSAVPIGSAGTSAVGRYRTHSVRNGV